jgi:hypothetical protein
MVSQDEMSEDLAASYRKLVPMPTISEVPGQCFPPAMSPSDLEGPSVSVPSFWPHTSLTCVPGVDAEKIMTSNKPQPSPLGLAVHGEKPHQDDGIGPHRCSASAIPGVWQSSFYLCTSLRELVLGQPPLVASIHAVDQPGADGTPCAGPVAEADEGRAGRWNASDAQTRPDDQPCLPVTRQHATQTRHAIEHGPPTSVSQTLHFLWPWKGTGASLETGPAPSAPSGARPGGHDVKRRVAKLNFPSTMEGHVARVRWHSFQRDVTLLAEQILLLTAAQNKLRQSLPE